MAALNFFIKPLSAEFQSRTVVAHVERGIAFYLTGSFAGGVAPHPFTLPHVLGLLQKCTWYGQPAKAIPLSANIKQQILLLIARHWQRDLGDLDIRMIANKLMLIPADHQVQSLRTITEILDHGKVTMKPSETIPADVMQRLQTSLASLEQALLAKDPMMPQHLRNSHSVLVSYPETVHLLDDSEIALIIDAAEVHTKTEIVKAVASSKGGGTRAKVSVTDL